VRRPHQRPDREVEPRRAELTLIAAPGLEVKDAVPRARVAQNDLNGLINHGVAAPAALVCQGSGIADAREREPVLYAGQGVAVAVEPGQGPDRARSEEKAVRVL
jgi:hypothetical protein